jgi:hypothetical protein
VNQCARKKSKRVNRKDASVTSFRLEQMQPEVAHFHPVRSPICIGIRTMNTTIRHYSIRIDSATAEHETD